MWVTSGDFEGTNEDQMCNDLACHISESLMSYLALSLFWMKESIFSSNSEVRDYKIYYFL